MEVVSGKEWLHRELLNSLTGEIIESAREEGAYEVFLLINGVKLDPKLFNLIFNNMEAYIDKEATSKIRDEFNLPEDDKE